MTYFRKNIEEMSGYTPGEQAPIERLIKLNTNENPYPMSPKALAALHNFDADLRRYPDPVANGVRDAAAKFVGLKRENIIAGNGSDDILTIVMRSFVGENDKVAYPEPSYSLYPVLANLQGGEKVSLPLTEDFQLPDNCLEVLEGCKLFLIPNPNAPTGNKFCKDKIRHICENFKGIVLIDEAYADFSSENCIDFIEQFDNVIVSRTLSKSFSLASARLGFAAAQPQLIEGMMKVKDSYNVNGLTQLVGEAALLDLDYMHECRDKVLITRERVKKELEDLGMEVLPSETNFLFIEPKVISASELFECLKKKNIFVRYFSAPITAKYIRISIGTDEEMDIMMDVIKKAI